jgi:hypothetical protein
MTILDFPTGGRSGRGLRSSHPTAVRALQPTSGAPPTGAWLEAYEQLAACCAEVVATSPLRVYDAEWDDLCDWIRTCLVALDDLKAPGAS